ncbi:hypothetical protein [Campylobacter massiliensis]|nr:hypothetical protein [Campylobacter massiliensis]
MDDEQQNLLALAIEKGHGVIVPFCDASSNGNDDVIGLKVLHHIRSKRY